VAAVAVSMAMTTPLVCAARADFCGGLSTTGLAFRAAD
jgi:predicted transcriptional regulator of viral defense system